MPVCWRWEELRVLDELDMSVHVQRKPVPYEEHEAESYLAGVHAEDVAICRHCGLLFAEDTPE